MEAGVIKTFQIIGGILLIVGGGITWLYAMAEEVNITTLIMFVLGAIILIICYQYLPEERKHPEAYRSKQCKEHCKMYPDSVQYKACLWQCYRDSINDNKVYPLIVPVPIRSGR